MKRYGCSIIFVNFSFCHYMADETLAAGVFHCPSPPLHRISSIATVYSILVCVSFWGCQEQVSHVEVPRSQQTWGDRSANTERNRRQRSMNDTQIDWHRPDRSNLIATAWSCTAKLVDPVTFHLPSARSLVYDIVNNFLCARTKSNFLATLPYFLYLTGHWFISWKHL